MDCGNMNIKDMAVYSPLKLLYSAYTDERPVVNTVITENFGELDKFLAPLQPKERNDVLTAFINIYTENERLAFTAGVQVGVRLARELAE